MFEPDFVELDKKWEQYMMFPAFKKSVEFLKSKGIIKTDADLARQCHISRSMLSQYLSGERPVTRAFCEVYQMAYKVNLHSLTAFEDLSWMEEYEKAGMPAVPPRAFMTAYKFFKEMVSARDLIIIGQQNVIDGLMRANQQLTSVIEHQELRVLKQVTSGTHYAIKK